jgi:uncharacterized protein (TIGR03083 family)
MDRSQYLETLHRESARFTEAAEAARRRHGWRAVVPGCPDWDLADLVWHLAEVQHFWGWLARTAATSPEGYPEPPRPADDELSGFLAEQTHELTDALARADDSDPVWTWAPQQDVGFVLRRQAQEATVHRVDAEQVLGQVTPVPAEVAVDGLDEWLSVMVPGALPGGPPSGAQPVALRAVDAAAERTLFAGTADAPVATLTGTAGDLLLTVWRRTPLGAVTVDGDADRAHALIATVRLE